MAGRPRSCHQERTTTAAAAAIRVQSAPVRAIAQRRRVTADVVLVSTAVSTSTGVSARVQTSTVDTSPTVMVGAWASPAAAGPLRWVSHEWTRAAAGSATPAATRASSTASDPAATSCWRALAPNDTSNTRSSSRTAATSRPASSNAASESEAPSSTATSTIERPAAR